MEKIEIRQQILHALEHLNKHQQARLLAFMKSLIYKKTTHKPDILQIAGTIDKDELKLMDEAIQEDCENINSNEW